MKRTYTKLTPAMVNQRVMVSGWVHSRRDHGGLIFIDLRDHTGIVQLVANPESPDAFACAEELRDEYVIRAEGQVRERASDLQNDKIPTGAIEIAVDSIVILNRAETLPIQPFAEENRAGEDLRFKYRYLDNRLWSKPWSAPCRCCRAVGSKARGCRLAISPSRSWMCCGRRIRRSNI